VEEDGGLAVAMATGEAKGRLGAGGGCAKNVNSHSYGVSYSVIKWFSCM
jgi:hypothetical protein